MYPEDDFSTNRHSAKTQDDSLSPKRHPDLSFTDGNIAILTGDTFFLVHRGLLARHSVPLASLLKDLDASTPRALEGCSVLQLEDEPKDMCCFLLALYDGVSRAQYTGSDFSNISAILRLSTKYQVEHIRADIIQGLSAGWPTTLSQWETREAKATNSDGIYEPRLSFPHPIQVVNLARATDTPALLPSAFYDLSRFSPSGTAEGFVCPLSSQTHRLSNHDLMDLLKGKEHASRFLSTFIVNELEGREPTPNCVYRMVQEPSRRRNCQAAFEAITFEILRDVNGVVCQRSSDPLFAIVDAELMQTRDDPSARQTPGLRVCEYCRLEFGSVVDIAREEFWQKLPVWFGVDPQGWA